MIGYVLAALPLVVALLAAWLFEMRARRQLTCASCGGPVPAEPPGIWWIGGEPYCKACADAIS